MRIQAKQMAGKRSYKHCIIRMYTYERLYLFSVEMTVFELSTLFADLYRLLIVNRWFEIRYYRNRTLAELVLLNKCGGLYGFTYK